MLVALHRQQDFLAGEGLCDGRGLRRLRFVPLAIILWSGVNVVRGGVAVDDGNGLADHQADYVGFVFAAALRQGDRIFRNVERTVAESLFNVNKNVLEVASAHDDVLGGVRTGAVGILAHVNFGGLWGGTVQLYPSRPARGSVRV